MRRMKKWVALAGGMLTLFWALFLFDELADDTRSAARRAPSEDVMQSKSLERPVAPSEPPPAVEPRLEPGPEQTAAEPASEVRGEATPPPVPASGHFELMRRAFDSETRDPVWAREQEARVPQLIADAGFPEDAFDRDVTCRATICRFHLRVAEQDMFALMKLAAAVQTSAGLSLAYGEAEDAGGKSRIAVYVPREGTSLADLKQR
jgi:hypothetical protein